MRSVAGAGRSSNQMAENVTLSRKQRAAVAALLSCGTVRAAAEQAGVSERQLYRWLEMPAFRAEVQRSVDGAVEISLRLLSDTSRIAVMTLRKVLEDRRSSPSVKVRAAGVVLSHLLALKELTELQRRVAALEGVHNGKRAGSG